MRSLFVLGVIATLYTLTHGIGQPYIEECLSGKYPPKGRPKVPSYVVNLNLPADQRWNGVVKDKGQQLRAMLAAFKGVLREWGNFSKTVIALVDEDVGYLADTLPAPFGDEMKGIAKASGLPLGEVVLFNIFYEVFTVCTSIVAEDPSGKLFHARNLDFGLFMGWNTSAHSWVVTDALRPLVVNLDFQKEGKTVFKMVSFAGYIGALTGMKPGVFTLTMNERFNKDGGYVGIIQWILGRRDIHWMSFLTRNTLEFASSYAEAQKLLSNTPMLAPAYFILGGNSTGQACVITRASDKTIDTWTMSQAGGWYVLETNYDHWAAPLFVDDRRTPANKCMQDKQRKNMSVAGLFDVLSSRPVLNKLTAYTALMQVNAATLETYLQYCPDPCYPW